MHHVCEHSDSKPVLCYCSFQAATLDTLRRLSMHKEIFLLIFLVSALFLFQTQVRAGPGKLACLECTLISVAIL